MKATPRQYLSAGAVVLLLGGAIAAFATGERRGTDEQRLARGAVLYADNCASCHGAELEGAEDWQSYNPDGTLKPPPHDASGHTWHHSDDQLFTYTKLGGAGAMADMPEFKSGMPAFKDILSDDEIHAVLDFIKSTWPQKIREAQTEMSRRSSQ